MDDVVAGLLHVIWLCQLSLFFNLFSYLCILDVWLGLYIVFLQMSDVIGIIFILIYYPLSNNVCKHPFGATCISALD